MGRKLSSKEDKELKALITDYKLKVNNYKQESNKINKQQIKSAISKMKSILHQSAVQTSMDFMGDTTDYGEVELMKNAFEWAIEFPEVLSDNGTFLGFDCIIGNPPYVPTKEVDASTKSKFEELFGFADDTYNMFTFKALKLVKQNGSVSFIVPKTFWTTQTKRNMRDLLLNNKIIYIFDTANPFESAMVDTCIFQVVKSTHNEDHEIIFLDGSTNLYCPEKCKIKQENYRNVQNSVIFKPTELNMKIYNLYGEKVKHLYNQWWDKIKTSKDIEKNKLELEKYRNSLKPGDITLLGCLTEGGQGLATANNGKYIAVRKSTKWAKNIIESRPKKLEEAIKSLRIKLADVCNYNSVNEFINNASENEIITLFDSLKTKYGRDIFGQGYIYRLVEDSDIANVDELSDDEKENGIDISKNYYVPYDKGDKDGNRWYLETPFAIAWSKENVRFLKTDNLANELLYQPSKN